MRTRLAFIIVLLAAALGAPGARGQIQDCDWPMYGHDVAHSFAPSAACSAVGPLNVATLLPKWFLQTPAPVTASPSVVDGVVYVGDAAGTFYAVDAAAGTVKWTFQVTDKNQDAYGKIVSSAAVDDVGGKRIVAFGGGSTLYVLDAANGALLAQSCFDPRTDPALRCLGSDQVIEIESSPAIVHMPSGEVRMVIGMDYNEAVGVGRAGLVELRLDTTPWDLVPLWKFDPETMQTYTTNPLTSGGAGDGCGNVWSSPAVDAAAGLVFFGTGNCDVEVADPAKFGEAIWAVDLSTGALVWRYAPRLSNNLDLDYGASVNLLPGGRVGEGGKDGFYYGLPRQADCDAPCANAPDWTAHASMDSDIGGMIGSTALGKVNGEDAIFATSAIPVSTRTGIDPTIVAEDPGRLFALHAIRASDGAILWHAPMPLPAYAAASYANGVVFLADTFGFSMQAYDANLGVPLWVFPLAGAPSSAPAIVGDSIYFGSGTAAPPVPALQLTGLWGFKLAA